MIRRWPGEPSHDASTVASRTRPCNAYGCAGPRRPEPAVHGGSHVAAPMPRGERADARRDHRLSVRAGHRSGQRQQVIEP
jgi:hypothetical protein